jgi:hypothetical protein
VVARGFRETADPTVIWRNVGLDYDNGTGPGVIDFTVLGRI